jgi:4-amino-4-deoxy-L-arabinose transferase-like glycosyltransferase
LLAIIGSLLVLLLALTVLPTSALRELAGQLPTRGSSGGSLTDALLGRHRIVFGSAALVVAISAMIAPLAFAWLDGLLAWLTSLDRRVFLIALLVATVGVRLLLADRMAPIVPNQDPGHYLQLAHTLLDEGRYIEYASHPGEPDGYRAWRPPGYPAALSVALFLTGRRPMAAVALNSFWMVVLLLALYGLSRQLASESEARLATLACALYPTLLAASLRVANELQFASLLMLACFFLFAYRRGVYGALLGGAALGVATLTRGNGLLMLPGFIAAYPFLVARGRIGSAEAIPWRSFAKRMAAIGLAFAIVVGPWVARNRAVLGEWVPVATSGGANMWWGHHPGATGVFPRPGEGPSFPEGLNEVEFSKFGARASLEYWLQEPLQNLLIGAKSILVILKVDSGASEVIIPRHAASNSNKYLRVSLRILFNLVYWGCWFAVGIWAITKLLRKWAPSSRPGALLFVIALYLLTYVPFFAWQRYKVPLLPFLAGAAAMVIAIIAARQPSAPATKEAS